MRLYKICGTRRNNSNNSPKKSRKVTRKSPKKLRKITRKSPKKSRKKSRKVTRKSPKKTRKVRRKKRKGGYSQYMSNQAFTPGVSFTGTNSLQGANSQPFPHSIYNHGEMNSNLINKTLNSNFSNSNSNSSLSPSKV